MKSLYFQNSAHILLAFLMRALEVSCSVLIVSVHLIRRDCVSIFATWEMGERNERENEKGERMEANDRREKGIIKCGLSPAKLNLLFTLIGTGRRQL